MNRGNSRMVFGLVACLWQVVASIEPGVALAAQRALLVGISRYDEPAPGRKATDWVELHASLDITNMATTLRDSWSFPRSNIHTLQEAAATRKGILDAFDRYLVAPASPGDVIVFYFSGHGQLLRDDDSPPDELDGLDESFVPWDYVSGRASDGAVTNLRDDDLGQLMQRLSDKMRDKDGAVKGSIAVILDCCHSQTLVRGELIARGRGWDDLLDGPLPKVAPTPKQGSTSLLDGDSTVPYVLLTACRSHESAFEVEDSQGESRGGALTFALCQALRKVGPESTWGDLFERVRLEVSGTRSGQHPTIFGQQDQRLFSGLVTPSEATPLVVDRGEGVVTLDVGSLQATTVGSRYRLHRPDHDLDDPAGHLVDVTISEVGTYRSIGRIMPGAKPGGDELLGSRAVPTSRPYEDDPLLLLLDGTDDLADAFEAVSGGEGDVIELVRSGAGRRGSQPTHDVRLSVASPSGGAGSGTLQLLGVDGTKLWEGSRASLDIQQTRILLLRLWRLRFLARLGADHYVGGLDVALRVVPVELSSDGTPRDRPLANRPDGDLEMTAGDFFQVEVVNRSAASLYVNILDLNPNGLIAAMIPPRQARIQDTETLVLPQQSRRFETVFQIEAPFGMDIIKLIATSEPVSFASLIDSPESHPVTRGGGYEAIADSALAIQDQFEPIRRLLVTAATGVSRGGASTLDPGRWGTASRTIWTVALSVQKD